MLSEAVIAITETADSLAPALKAVKTRCRSAFRSCEARSAVLIVQYWTSRISDPW
jgi:hypothetical protein